MSIISVLGQTALCEKMARSHRPTTVTTLAGIEVAAVSVLVLIGSRVVLGCGSAGLGVDGGNVAL